MLDGDMSFGQCFNTLKSERIEEAEIELLDLKKLVWVMFFGKIHNWARFFEMCTIWLMCRQSMRERLGYGKNK